MHPPLGVPGGFDRMQQQGLFVCLTPTLLQESIGFWVARGNRRKSQGWMPRSAM
jgi:hypothetical protein